MGKKGKYSKYCKPKLLRKLKGLPFPEPEKSVVKELLLMKEIDGLLLKSWHGLIHSLWMRRNAISEQIDAPKMTALEYRKEWRKERNSHKRTKGEPSGAINYNDYINSPEWQKKRRSFNSREAVCLSCGVGGVLDLHHVTYQRLGEEGPDDCVWVCRGCHKNIHRLEKRMTLRQATSQVCS